MARNHRSELRRRFAPIVFLAALSLTAGASPATATVTIGSDLATPPTQGVGCSPEPCSFSQTALPGRLVASPVNGTVVRWRIVMYNAGSVRLRVLRPLASGVHFLHSGATESAGDGSNAFASALPISIGDRIGAQIFEPTNVFIGALGPSAHPVSGAAHDFWEASAGGPPDGATVPPTGTTVLTELLFNADVEPTSTFTLDTSKPVKKARVRVTATLPNAGTFEAGDRLDLGIGAVASATKRPKRLLKRAAVAVGAPGKATLLVKPTKAARKKLERKAKRTGRKQVRIRAKLRLAFTPAFGSPTVEVVKVKLKR